MKNLLLSAAAFVAASTSTIALGATTGLTGLGLPFDNRQPSLAVTEAIPTIGLFPGGAASGDTLGFIYAFGGNFAPGTSFAAQGQVLPIAPNPVLFSLLGTTYGGNGFSNFGLPNLQAIAVLGAGTGPGLSPRTLGAATGSASVTLTTSQIPPHSHTLPGGGATGLTGGGRPFSNMQPSLPLHALIATSGVFPSRDTGSNAAFLGQVATFAGTTVPSGWADAAGQLLSISADTALFSILGTTYGGDGKATFRLPDLRGRVAVGVDAAKPLGSRFGEEATDLTTAQLPPHIHRLPGGGATGMTGGGQPVTNDQPSLALNYLIATSGNFPQRGSGAGFDPTVPTLGEITEFAGDFAPHGWALADGQLLPIAANTQLFFLLGNQYGGDGKLTFALPDFRGRTLVGTGLSGGLDYLPGTAFGEDLTTLTIANLPAHDHTLPNPTPEPGSLALLGTALLCLGVSRRARG